MLQTAKVGIFWGIFAESILSLRTQDLPDQNVPVYITAYLSEVAHLDATDKRSIHVGDVYIDNDPYPREINPPFRRRETIGVRGILTQNKREVFVTVDFN